MTKPAKKYARKVGAAARAAGALSCHIVEVPTDFPDKWDLADPAPDGVNLRAILEGRQGRMLATITLGELMELPDDADWLVNELLPSDGISILAAPPKVGKSTLVRCLATCVARGLEWLGRETKQGDVLHLALEERAFTVAQHYSTLAAPRDRIHIMLARDKPDPVSRFDMLRETIRHLHPRLVIIDSLFRWTDIQDGNAYAEVMAKLEPTVNLSRECKAHILLIHHARKSGGEYGAEVLGSQGLTASVDTIMSLERDNGHRTLYATGRDGVDMEKVVLTMDKATGWVTASGTKREADRMNVARLVLAFLRDQTEPVTQSVIIEGVEAKTQTIIAALTMLTRDADIVVSGEGVRGKPWLYSLPVREASVN